MLEHSFQNRSFAMLPTQPAGRAVRPIFSRPKRLQSGEHRELRFYFFQRSFVRCGDKRKQPAEEKTARRAVGLGCGCCNQPVQKVPASPTLDKFSEFDGLKAK
jgi:hypothetical protein